MTKLEVTQLIYDKKQKHLSFTEEEKKLIQQYYSEEEFNCMNMVVIDMNSCVKRCRHSHEDLLQTPIE